MILVRQSKIAQFCGFQLSFIKVLLNVSLHILPHIHKTMNAWKYEIISRVQLHISLVRVSQM